MPYLEDLHQQEMKILLVDNERVWVEHVACDELPETIAKSLMPMAWLILFNRAQNCTQ